MGHPRPFSTCVVEVIQRQSCTGLCLAEGADKGTAYARTTVLPTRVTSLEHVLLLATMRLLGPCSTISVVGCISWWPLMSRDRQLTRLVPCLGACTACPACVRVLCTCLRIPCTSLCVCQPVCLNRCCMPASVYGACVCLLCACALKDVPGLCLRLSPTCLVYMLNFNEFPTP